jgi:hypothetical protein
MKKTSQAKNYKKNKMKDEKLTKLKEESLKFTTLRLTQKN